MPCAVFWMLFLLLEKKALVGVPVCACVLIQVSVLPGGCGLPGQCSAFEGCEAYRACSRDVLLGMRP